MSNVKFPGDVHDGTSFPDLVVERPGPGPVAGGALPPASLQSWAPVQAPTMSWAEQRIRALIFEGGGDAVVVQLETNDGKIYHGPVSLDELVPGDGKLAMPSTLQNGHKVLVEVFFRWEDIRRILIQRDVSSEMPAGVVPINGGKVWTPG